MYNVYCCGMIAVKREVAASKQLFAGFPWSECQVSKTDDKSLYRFCSTVAVEKRP
jgi:hypothetical protein